MNKRGQSEDLVALTHAQENRALAVFGALVAREREIRTEIASLKKGASNEVSTSGIFEMAFVAKWNDWRRQKIATLNDEMFELGPEIARARTRARRAIGKHQVAKQVLKLDQQSRQKCVDRRSQRNG